MNLSSLWWWDLSTREFAEIDRGRVVAVLPHTAALLRRLRSLGFPVIHTRESVPPDLSGVQPNRLWRGPDGLHPVVGDPGPLGRHRVAGEPGWAIVPEVAPLGAEAVFDKPSYSVFGTTADRAGCPAN